MPMRRNRFDEIMSSVHLVDNMKITADPFFKVRPLFERLNDINNRIPIAEHVAVDEMMIEYFGRHVCKQFIRRKPIRFGYKIWSLASSSGFVHQMEPYAGRHTGLVETGLGQGPKCGSWPCKESWRATWSQVLPRQPLHNPSLLDEMTLRGYGNCGTMRQNQLHNVPFTAAQTFKKLRRRDGTNRSGAWTRSDSPSVSKTITHTWEEWTCMTSLSAATESTSVPRSGGGHASAGPLTVPWWTAGAITGTQGYMLFGDITIEFVMSDSLVLFGRQHHKLKYDIAFTEHSTYGV